MSKPVIVLEHVQKDYYLQEDRTFKEMVSSLLRGKSPMKKYTVFSNLSFSVYEGEIVGIVGKNGAGKSTLLKLIAGVTSPTKGVVDIQGKVAPLIELGAGFHPELSGYENIFLNAAILGMHKKEVEKQLRQIVEFSELGEFIHVPVKRYSSGMYMRLGFSIAMHVPAPILLIDEVLAVGDFLFQKKCLQKLQLIKKDRSRTIIFVSHNEDAVSNFCERALLLQDGNLIKDSDPLSVFTQYHKL